MRLGAIRVFLCAQRNVSQGGQALRSLVCVGECMIEFNQAGPNSTGSGDALMSRAFGGDVLNTAVYAARRAAGRCRVAFATALGDDPFSDGMLKAWQAEGLETDLVLRFADRLPGLYAIQTDASGERRFYYWRDRSAARDLFKHEATATLAGRLTETEMLYFSGISLAILDEDGRDALLDAAARVRAAGGHVAFDPNYRARLWPDVATAADWTGRAVRTATICLPGLEDTAALDLGSTAGEVIEGMRTRGVEEVVVKDGPRANILAVDSQPPIELDSDPVAAPVDTTAAGDSFNGAYLAERLIGTAPADAVDAGRAMAAWVVQHRGAIVPRQEESRQ